MIDFKHVYKSYNANKPCLRDISFEVQSGEFLYLVGPSGAGKTTMFKIISAYEAINSGAVSVLGHDLSKLKTGQIPFLRQKIGFVLQNYKLLKNKTVFQNIELPLTILKESKNNKRDKIGNILDRLEITSLANEFPEHLSGGEQQRVAIARALVHNPKLVIADEPTGNLDPELSVKIINLFKDSAFKDTTFIVATHDYRLIDLKKDRVIQIKDGSVLEGIS